MDLPAPDASDELIGYIDTTRISAENWYEISAGLLAYERDKHDVQAGWLMTAFDYNLSRRVREERNHPDAFGDKMAAGGIAYPTPIASVPEEVATLWGTTAIRVTTAPPRARLHHLLFECGHGNKGTHGREAAAAYLAIGASSWDRLERVNCLHWAVDLSKRVGDLDEAAKAYPELVALAKESMNQEKREPGVALHALEILAYEDTDNPELPQLLERARKAYGDDPFLTSDTIRIQEQLYRQDSDKREQLRRDTAEAYFAHAEKFPPGLLRMAFLEDAAKLATQYGLPDLLDKATAAMQEMTLEDMRLQTFSATASIPVEVVDDQVFMLLEKTSLREIYEGISATDPPTGDIERNMESTQQLAEQAPLSSLFPTKHLGKDALPIYTASSEAERIDEQLSRIEIMGLGIGGEVTSRVFEGGFERFTPSEDELIKSLQGLPHVSVSIARSLARALLAFQAGSYEAAATIAMPRIESLVRALCQEKNVLRYRPQRDQKQGPSTRGQFPQLGALLKTIEPWMDRSWHRFFWTFFVSPFGPNFRNELLHGKTEEVTRTHASLTILAALHLALVPLTDISTAVKTAPADDESSNSE